jgi:glycerophosphoryl diester phosphodiesterase
MLPTHFQLEGRPLVWAHRGASSDAPENTVAERCSSGEVVVLHDDSLRRTTGHGGVLTRTPWSLVRTLDAGSWKGERFRGERVPLLAEVLEAFPRLVNVELKCDDADDRGLTAAVARVVRDARAAQRVLISSFNPLCVLRARWLLPEAPRALLFERAQHWALRSALAAPALGVAALHPEHLLATPERVARWTRRGYAVACWTVDDPQSAARLYDSGVTGIITNRPALLRAQWPS